MRRIGFKFLGIAFWIVINAYVASPIFGLILFMNGVWAKRGMLMLDLQIVAIMLTSLITAMSNASEEKPLGGSCLLRVYFCIHALLCSMKILEIFYTTIW